MTQTKDPNNLISQTIFDPLDRVVTMKRPDPAATSTLATTTTYAYTDSGMPRMVHKSDYLNSATTSETYTYLDGFGRTIEERIEAEGDNTYAVTDRHYNALGLLMDESLPYFSSSTAFTATSSPVASYLLTRFVYDPLQRLLTAANTVGTTTNAYDQWKVTTTDANGHIKGLIKDARGNLAQVIEHGSTAATTTYEYNGNSNLTKITDALGNIRNFTYDGLGRRLKAEDLHASTDTSFGSTTFAFDDAGNLTTMVDAKNRTVNYTYDDLNRPLTEDFTGQSGTETTYSYDWCPNGKGRICTVLSAGASTTNEYNGLGLLSKETKTIASTTFATSYSYDRLGNKTLITYPDLSQVSYAFNAAGLLESVAQKETGGSFANIISNFDYAPTGKVTRKEFGNGIVSTYTYDASKLYRLTHILTIAPSGGMMMMGGGAGGELGLLDQPAGNAAIELALAPFASLLSETFAADPAITTAATSTEDGAIAPDAAATTTEPDTATTTAEIATTTTESDIATTTDTSADDVQSATDTPLATIAENDAASSLQQSYENDASIKGAYALKGGALVKTAGDLSVTIGDPNAPTLEPKATFEKWGEASFQIGLRAETATSSPAQLVADKIEWRNALARARFYELPASQELPGGGYEMDVVLSEKPATNVVTFDIDVENLDAFYQPALDQDPNAAEADHCTQTQCFDKEGHAVIERPENVVGSYAFYYRDGVSGDHSALGGKNYGTGKAFHIYRPRITDAAGNGTWGELHLDQAAGTMTVTVPQEFIDTAEYPITVDPTFGYGTIGASSGSTANAAGSKFTMPENGTITQISEYTKAGSGTINVGAAVYSDNAGAPNSLLTSHTSTPSQGTTASWVNVPVTSYTAATGSAYWLWGWGSASRTIYWDTGATNQYNVQGLTWPTWTNPITPGTYFARKISIYATYTASSTNTAPTAPSNLLAEGQTNPTNVTDNTPEFSAIYEDSDAGDVATSYEIQVSTSSAFSSTYWDSNKTTLASSTPKGTRIADISYAGSALASSTTYYWRIKFWDNADASGAWSTTTSTFSLAAGSGTSTPSFVSIIQNIYFTYDAVGNITEIKDQSDTGAGKTIAFGYDNLNRLTTASTTAASSTPFSQTYAYNPIGDITSKSDVGSYTYAGDSGSNYANPHAVTSIGGTSYGYDNNGNLLSVTAGLVNTWDYRNRLTASGLGGATTTYAYGPDENRVQKVSGGVTTLFPNDLYNIASNGTITKQLFAGTELIATIQSGSGGGGGSTSTPAYVQGGSTSSGTSVTLGSPVTSGNLVVVAITAYNQSIPSNAVTDNKGNTYTKIGEAINGVDHAAIFYAANVTGGSSFTASTTVDGSFSVQEYSGTSTSSPFDKVATSIGTSATPSSGNVTTTVGNELYVGLAWSEGDGDTWTAGYGYTKRREETNNSTSERFATEDKVVSSGTTTPAYFTTSTSAPWAAIIATFKPGSSSGSSGTSTYYVHPDHLGGANAITDTNANVVETTDYYPFGSERLHSGTFSEPRKFIGEEYDSETSLSYLNARYYDGSKGQFISEDPIFWTLPVELLFDPQQQNSYNYARNNPISLSDPSGLLTVVIPGTNYSTNAWSRTGAAKDFIASVDKTFGETSTIINDKSVWSGGDNNKARQVAASYIAGLINDHDFADGEKLNIIGHSHGGNIGILVSTLTSRKIDNLITLGTPARSDYRPNYDMIGQHINVYSNADIIQHAGGTAGYSIFGASILGGAGFSLGRLISNPQFGPAGGTFSGATNINVTRTGFSLIPTVTHSSYWQNPAIWSQITSHL